MKPEQRLAELVREEWEQSGWMQVGAVPADWREKRCRVHVAVHVDSPRFLDVNDASTLQILDERLRPQLDAWQVDQLDTP